MITNGAITALITPFKNQVLDEEGLASNIAYQIEQGISGILPLGTTGESSTLTAAEQQRVISIAVREAKGKVPIWVGTGTYCTRQTIEKTKQAKDLGADAALVVTPFYNKPTQEGIYRHFEALSLAVDMPLVAYNHPGRCGTNIEASTLLRIAGLPNIIGVKEASDNINQAAETLHAIAGKHPRFSLFSGNDSLALPLMALGAVGVVSVISNLIPRQVVDLTSAALQGRFDLAKKIHYQLLPLYKAACMETNPIPIKAAMALCGMASGECRLPLCSMGPENKKYLQELLVTMQLITA